MQRTTCPVLLGSIVLCFVAESIAFSQERADAAGIEFFEKKIRPLFDAHCHECHGVAKQRGGLRLDSRVSMLRGGDRGPVIVPGDPKSSLLIKAVEYGQTDLQMPPRRKLQPDKIRDLSRWIEMGAPWPAEEVHVTAATPSEFDLEERRRHWCYQPVQRPALPAVRDALWPTGAVDYFILSKLEQAGLRPAAAADRRTLIRRVTFDLTGLPPTADEIRAFLADESPDAFARVVERLLASPRYGERWGRHWLDLVRYAETLGHEFDFDLLNAWRYRDYVIRSFNDDLPYDQFVLEHIAGDLLPAPRRHPVTQINESVIATGFYWLGEATHSPVDVRQNQADRIDNQIDVLGKAFLAQTIACARCHDHKFDAISTRDYYALAGFLKSSRYEQASLDRADLNRGPIEELDRLRGQLQESLLSALNSANVANYLAAATELLQRGGDTSDAAGRALDAAQLAKWIAALRSDEIKKPEHPLHAWSKFTDATGEELRHRLDSLQSAVIQQVRSEQEARTRRQVFADFDNSISDWFISGAAFAGSPTGRTELHVAAAGEPSVALVSPGVAHSGLVSSKLEGALRSQTFTLDKEFIHFRVAGRGTRVNLIVDGLTIIRDPIYGGLTIEPNSASFTWRTMKVGMWKGHRAYIELIDSATPNMGKPASESAPPGYLAIDEIVFSDEAAAPARPNPVTAALATSNVEPSATVWAARFETLVRAGVETAGSPAEVLAGVELVNWLLREKLVDPLKLPGGEGLAANTPNLLDQIRLVESQTAAPTRAPAMVDGTGEDEYVFLRGNYRTLGERAPRRLMEAIAGSHAELGNGSGRLELARQIIDPKNPLTARVMVNRIWQHHFGAGLVRSPDDFGRMGETPTHPELLDYLADEFVRSGWSVKPMHRLMLLSSTYQMASGEVANSVELARGAQLSEAEQTDPQNRLLHRMPVRRLEAEAIRDAILSASGRLDPMMFGPGVPPHLTPFMEGRGRPNQSGPIDGRGRRSVYLAVRRNFLSPMFLAFDYPVPFSTMGRRTVSNVPAQALTLMNNPFVIDQASAWASRLPHGTPNERIATLYEQAFGREPTQVEIDESLQFVNEASRRLGISPDDPRAWADLCHVLFNVKEFAFVQ